MKDDKASVFFDIFVVPCHSKLEEKRCRCCNIGIRNSIDKS